MKTSTEIQRRIDQIEADERKHYLPADVFINAPLALIQVSLDTEANTLRWVLNNQADSAIAVPQKSDNSEDLSGK